MSRVSITRSKLDALAVAVSVKSGEELPLTIDEMREAVNGISSGTAAISVVDTTDSHGGTIREIMALDISDTTAVASDVAAGKYFYTAQGTKTQGTASGGGSSDYSTATVTFANTSDGIYAQFEAPMAMEESIEYGLPASMVIDYIGVDGGSSETRTVVLYKGCFMMGRDYGNTTLSGSASFALDGDAILVTGDCTITVNLDS